MKPKTKRRLRQATFILGVLYLITHYWVFNPRFWQLQLLGRVPDNAVYPIDPDWQLAQATWWWGKPIDAQAFWQGRAIWHDTESESRAWRYGRRYPPMPFEDSSVADRSNRGKISRGVDLAGGPIVRFVSSEREHAFWDKFTKTHPLPPEVIEREQRNYGASMVRTEYMLAHDPSYSARLRLKPGEPQEIIESARYHLRPFGFPDEALSSNALFWAYVFEERENYDKIMSVCGSSSLVVSNYLKRLHVDQRSVTQPLTDRQIEKANAWKLHYLSRLRCEGTDESYIRAYMKRWGFVLEQLEERKNSQTTH